MCNFFHICIIRFALKISRVHPKIIKSLFTIFLHCNVIGSYFNVDTLLRVFKSRTKLYIGIFPFPREFHWIPQYCIIVSCLHIGSKFSKCSFGGVVYVCVCKRFMGVMSLHLGDIYLDGEVFRVVWIPTYTYYARMCYNIL